MTTTHPSLVTPQPRRRFSWARTLSVAAFVFVSGSALQATTYYVKNGGSDSADGLSDATAWASVSKVTNHSFSDGDQILFKRGGTWTATGSVFLKPGTGSGGTSGNPIVFGAYGTGAKPVLDGAGLANPCVRIQSRSYVVIQDLMVEHSAGTSAGISIESSSFITVQRVDVTNSGGPGISGITSGNVVIDGCTVQNSGNNGIVFTGSASSPVHDCTVQNCTVQNTLGNDGITLHQGSGASDTGGANFTFRNNVVIGNASTSTAAGSPEQGFDITTGSNILLEDNETYDNPQGGVLVGHSANGVTIRRHYSHNEPTAATNATLAISAPNVTVEYSRFIGSAGQNKPVVRIYAGDQQPDDLKLFNNVFAWDNAGNGTAFILVSGATPASFTMKNNIFVSGTSGNMTLNYQESTRPPDFSGFAIDNNSYWSNAAGNTKWSVGGGASINFAGYQSTYARDGNGQEADPVFVNLAAGDFHLDTGSPAIDAGASVTLTESVDFEGDSVPQNGTPDIGVDEVLATTPAAPSSLQATAVSSSEIDLSWVDNSNNETGFKVDRATNATFSAGLVTATTLPNATSYNSTGLSAATTYYYRVRAVNGSNESSNSNTASATTSSSSNLLANPGFESTSGWTNFPGTYALQNSSDTHSGTYDLKITTSGFPQVYQQVSVTPGNAYAASVWSKTWSTDGLSRGQMVLQFYQNTTALGSPVAVTSTSGNTWAQLTSGSLTAPAGATHLRITLKRSASLDGNYYFDDAVITETVGNLLANPGFESTSDWTNFPGTYALQNSSDTHSGTYDLKITTSGFPQVYQQVSVTPGNAYTASVWSKTWSTDGLSRGQMVLQFYQNTTALGSPVAVTSGSGNTWTQLTSGSLTAPAGATHLRITLKRSASLDGNYYFDDAKIQ